MSTQLATLKTTLNSDAMREQFARALPKHLSPERFCRIAITALTRTPKLQECTQESLMKCLLDLSAFGLEPDGRRAHLIPYKDQCTLVIDWKGLAELAMRSGIVAKLHADVVCENDEFTYDLGEVKAHKIDFRKPRGEVYAVYAMAQTKTGEVFVAVLAKDEVESVRKRSRAGTSGPWVTDWNEMAKKTAFRRLSKWLPLSPEFRDAQERDDEEDTPPMRDVTPSASTSKLFKHLATNETVASPVASTAGQENEAAALFSEVEITPLDEVKSWLTTSGVKWEKINETLYTQGVTNDLRNNPDDCTDDELREVLAMRTQLEAIKRA
jgi:recombination protein RecT